MRVSSLESPKPSMPEGAWVKERRSCTVSPGHTIQKTAYTGETPLSSVSGRVNGHTVAWRRARYDQRTTLGSVHYYVCPTGATTHFMVRRRRGGWRGLTHPASAQYPRSLAPMAYGSRGWHRHHGPYAHQNAHHG